MDYLVASDAVNISTLTGSTLSHQIPSNPGNSPAWLEIIVLICHIQIFDVSNDVPFLSIDKSIKLDKGLLSLSQIGMENRTKVFKGIFVEGRERTSLDLKDVYVTEEELARKSAIANQTKAVIVTRTEEMVGLFSNEFSKSVLSEKLAKVKKSIGSTKKQAILSLYEETMAELQGVAEELTKLLTQMKQKNN